MLIYKTLKSHSAFNKAIMGTLMFSVFSIANSASAKIVKDAHAIKKAAQKQLLVAQNSTVSTSTSLATGSSPTASTLVMQVPAPEKAAEKPWAVEMNLEQSSNMVRESDPNAKASATFTIIPAYKITDKLKISARADVEKEQTGAKNTNLADSSLSLTLKGFKFNDTYSTEHTLTGVIPSSEKSQKDDKLKTAVALGNRLILDGKEYGTYTYTLGLRENFHEYTINREGSPNIKYSVSHRVITKTPLFGSAFGFNTDLIFKNSWTYNNFQRSSFAFSLDLSYDATEKFGVYVGTTNEGSALKANGKDSNIEFYNENTSVVRAGLTYVL